MLAVRSNEPTATQLTALVHDTPLRSSPMLPRLGLGKTAQAVPFHDSVNVIPLDSPTAMQLVALKHDTLFS